MLPCLMPLLMLVLLPRVLYPTGQLLSPMVFPNVPEWSISLAVCHFVALCAGVLWLI